MPGRPRLPKPKLPSRKKTRKKDGAKKPTGVWFRVSTRFTAIGYWIREKWQSVDRGLRAASEWVAKAGRRLGRLWTDRSRDGRVRIVAVASVLLLYMLLKFTPVPLVPCEVSSVKECAPPDETVALVPADALMYAHVTLDDETDQFERAEKLADRLPDELVDSIAGAIPLPSVATLDIRANVLPWAKRDLAVTLIAGPRKASAAAFIAGVEDREGAEEFLASIAPGGVPAEAEQAGAPLRVWAGGFAAAYVDDNLVFGLDAAVRAVLDTAAGERENLPGSAQEAPRGGLPEARFAEVYLSRAGVQRLLAGQTPATGATQLETFVNYGATTGMAASATTRDDGVELVLVSRLDPKLLERSPAFFAELPRFEPGLSHLIGGRAIAYAGLGEVGPTLNALLEGAGQEAQGLAGALRGLAQRLEQEAGVDPLADLLPALGGQAALVAEPTDGPPRASLIVDDVDEDRAEEALAGLQAPLLRALQAPGAPQIPRFEQQEVAGVTVHSVQVSPAINLSYAVFDETLVVSTDPSGIEQVRSEGRKLANSELFVESIDDLPDEVSALVFLNLEELFAQIRQTDLVEDPGFAGLSISLDNVSALALAVRGSQEEINSEMFVAIPED